MNNKNMIKLFGKIVLIELIVILPLILVVLPLLTKTVSGDVDENVTVISNLSIGASDPNIISVSLEAGTITLVPNSTKTVNCSVIAEDYDGEANIDNVNAVLFAFGTSSYGGADDNNTHYTNSSCVIDTTYGDAYQIKADCFFEVQYYTDPGIWNCSVIVNDSIYTDFGSNSGLVLEMLALGLPNIIDYGTINATFVSDEQIANISNVGNVLTNLSLSSYGLAEGDGHGMVCDFGVTQNITAGFEKYNLTESIPGDLTYAQFENNYTNMTSSIFVQDLGLEYRQNDAINDMINTTYWRVYVPAGVAGTCNGTVLFGAIESVAS